MARSHKASKPSCDAVDMQAQQQKDGREGFMSDQAAGVVSYLVTAPLWQQAV